MRAIYVHQHLQVVLVMNVKEDGIQINATYVIQGTSVQIATNVIQIGLLNKICSAHCVDIVIKVFGVQLVKDVQFVTMTILVHFVETMTGGETIGMKVMLVNQPDKHVKMILIVRLPIAKVSAL